MTNTSEKFEKYDAANPHVFELLIRFAREMQAAGHAKLSISLLIERVRWETAIKTVGDRFKIRNDFKPLYARKLSELPEFSGAFILHRRWCA